MSNDHWTRVLIRQSARYIFAGGGLRCNSSSRRHLLKPKAFPSMSPSPACHPFRRYRDYDETQGRSNFVAASQFAILRMIVRRRVCERQPFFHQQERGNRLSRLERTRPSMGREE